MKLSAAVFLASAARSIALATGTGLEMQLSPGSYYFRSYSSSHSGASSKLDRISVGGH